MNPYMNSYLVSLIVIALYLAYALLLLLIGALIVRSDIYRRWAERTTHHSRPAPIKDLRPGHEPVITDALFGSHPGAFAASGKKQSRLGSFSCSIARR